MSDIKDRVFSTKIRMLPNDKQIAILELQINQAIQANPDLLMYMNTFKILRLAKENVKLAEEYFRLSLPAHLRGQDFRINKQ